MTPDPAEDQLSERARHLLRVLVESYIREGQPVGSRTLSRDSGLLLSSATVRNVMADLEELGFVSSPHTSAGPRARPTRATGSSSIRCCGAAPPKRRTTPSTSCSVVSIDDQERDPKALVAVASQVLSSITHLAGVVTHAAGSRRSR